MIAALPGRVGYRVAQFWRSLGAAPSSEELQGARQLLNPAQLSLFLAMSPRDQWHAVRTLCLLGEAGEIDRELAVAALLHDAGKCYIRLHQRVLYVVLSGLPPLLDRCASSCGPAWRTALYRSLHHAEAGSRLALQAGASRRCADLIGKHHTSAAADPALQALIAADDRA